MEISDWLASKQETRPKAQSAKWISRKLDAKQIQLLVSQQKFLSMSQSARTAALPIPILASHFFPQSQPIHVKTSVFPAFGTKSRPHDGAFTLANRQQSRILIFFCTSQEGMQINGRSVRISLCRSSDRRRLRRSVTRRSHLNRTRASSFISLLLPFPSRP